MQKEKLEKILIPYCTCLESTIKTLSEVEGKKASHEEVDLQQWGEDLEKPVEYLDAAKRVYLSNNSRELLKKYSEIINLFKVNLDKEYTKCLMEYNNYLENIINRFPNVGYFMDVEITMDQLTENKIKLAILNKSEISLLNNVARIRFIYNDDPEDYVEKPIALNNEMREIWGAINYGSMDFSDIDDDGKITCILLDFISENTKNEKEKEKLKEIIDNTSGFEEFKNIYKTLDEMRNKLIKEIDKIAM